MIHNNGANVWKARKKCNGLTIYKTTGIFQRSNFPFNTSSALDFWKKIKRITGCLLSGFFFKMLENLYWFCKMHSWRTNRNAERGWDGEGEVCIFLWIESGHTKEKHRLFLFPFFFFSFLLFLKSGQISKKSQWIHNYLRKKKNQNQ